MGVNIKIPVVVNKKNGQINTYFKQKQLPKEVVDSIKKQHTSVKRFFLEFKGWE